MNFVNERFIGNLFESGVDKFQQESNWEEKVLKAQ